MVVEAGLRAMDGPVCSDMNLVRGPEGFVGISQGTDGRDHFLPEKLGEHVTMIQVTHVIHQLKCSLINLVQQRVSTNVSRIQTLWQWSRMWWFGWLESSELRLWKWKAWFEGHWPLASCMAMDRLISLFIGFLIYHR